MAARTTEPAAPIHDREAAEAAWQKQIIDAAAAQAERDARAAAQGRTDDTRPDRAANIDRQAEQAMQDAHAAAKGRTDELSGTAADIRMAWSLSRMASELEVALAGRGISLAVPGAEEAQASQRTADFAKEVGNFARSFAEGEIVAVDGRGHVYRLDERTTGQSQSEIAGRLAGIDRAGLLG